MIPLFTDKPSRYPWLGDVSEETISQLLVLAKLAYDGTKEDRLIFHGIGGALETLGRKGCGLFVSIVTTFGVWPVSTCTIWCEVQAAAHCKEARALPQTPMGKLYCTGQ